MQRYDWFCLLCLANSSITLPGDATVRELVTAIENTHKSMSPTCMAGSRELRVVSWDSVGVV